MAGLIALSGICKSFGQVTVADDVTMQVEAGRMLGIVGPNGAGKSTLFAMISGDIFPDAGHVLLEGRDVTGLPAHRRCQAGIGRTYQIPRPFEKMSVFENVLVSTREGAGMRGNAAAQHAADTLETCGLLREANRLAGALPLMLRKRLEIARGLATDPKVLLLDEVAGGLTDPEVAELIELIQSVHSPKMAVIWIEHVVHALVKSVDWMACLAGGSIIADGMPHDVLTDATVRELYLGQAPGSSEGAA